MARAITLLGAVSLLGLVACQTKPSIPDRSALEVQAFVRQTFIHGVPYAAAQQFDQRVVPVLWQMLADPVEERHWPNIVVTLAIVGEAEVTERLMEFVRSDHDGVLSPGHYAAKTAALMALGYNVNQTGDARCLNYLIRCTDPAYWRSLGLSWRAPFPQSLAERNNQLANLAVLGLALSGTSEAERQLEFLQDTCSTPQGAELRAAVGDVLEDAIAACRKIQQQGLIEYSRPTH